MTSNPTPPEYQGHPDPALVAERASAVTRRFDLWAATLLNDDDEWAKEAAHHLYLVAEEALAQLFTQDTEVWVPVRVDVVRAQDIGVGQWFFPGDRWRLARYVIRGHNLTHVEADDRYFTFGADDGIKVAPEEDARAWNQRHAHGSDS